MLSLREIAYALGGHVCDEFVLAPGPGHSKRDRSLKVTPRAEDGFVVHSFAGDDWRVCHNYVLETLGLVRDVRVKPRQVATPWRPVYRTQERYAKARGLWGKARTGDLRWHLKLVYPSLFKNEAAWREAFRLAGDVR